MLVHLPLRLKMPVNATSVEPCNVDTSAGSLQQNGTKKLAGQVL